MRRYPGGGAFALFFHLHPREFATQNKKSANARGLARGGGGGWAQLELTDALKGQSYGYFLLFFCHKFPTFIVPCSRINCFQTTKKTKSNELKEKYSQNQFLPILSETLEQKT